MKLNRSLNRTNAKSTMCVRMYACEFLLNWTKCTKWVNFYFPGAWQKQLIEMWHSIHWKIKAQIYDTKLFLLGAKFLIFFYWNYDQHDNKNSTVTSTTIRSGKILRDKSNVFSCRIAFRATSINERTSIMRV